MFCSVGRDRPVHHVARFAQLAPRRDRLVGPMLKLQVPLGHEAEVVRADILEGADPFADLSETAYDLALVDLEVALFLGEEVTGGRVDLEILRLLKLLQEVFCDLH